jgi:hypothetical protein
MRRAHLNLLLALLAAVVVAAAPWTASGSELGQQSSRAGGVTVTAEPVDLSVSATTWTFEIVQETHSAELTDDLQRTATLGVPGSAAQSASAGEGEPPGGHHRKGMRRFAPTTTWGC